MIDNGQVKPILFVKIILEI